MKKKKAKARVQRIWMTVAFLALTAVYYVLFAGRLEMSDTAEFGGDIWEYQSMAVNFAMGHGVHRFGAMEPFETYKFAEFDTPPAYYQEFFDLAGEQDFIRTPAYPLFVGIIYKLFGISPAVVKAIQLLMLAIIAASLPLIGMHYWGRIGLIGGIPAGFLYLSMNYVLADWILTETLISFSVFLVLVTFLLYEKREETRTAIFLGIALGLALLVKGSLVFLPILTGGVLLVRALRQRNVEKLRLLLFVAGAAALTVSPWSVYASGAADETIILSVQGDTQLLDDNNELCVDGGWHPEWAEDENAFYNTDGIDNSRAMLKVVNFYLKHPVLLPVCTYNKFIMGFGPLPFFWVFAGLLLMEWLFRWTVKRMTQDSQPVSEPPFLIPVPFWVIFGNFLLITLIFHGENYVVPSRFVAPMDFIFALLLCVYLVRLGLMAYKSTQKQPPAEEES